MDRCGACANVEEPPYSRVGGVILAAGLSRRFGTNKLLAPFLAKPLVRWVVEAALGSEDAVRKIVAAVTPVGQAVAPMKTPSETVIMLVVLGLIDVVMISNLLIMVIVGGYETFVSRMNLEGHPDQPEWLSHVNASVLKVKLATAIIGISSIHLLKTFINANSYSEKALIAQTAIHVAFLVSAMAIAACDRIMPHTAKPNGHH